jgi:ribosomal protein L37AE/L43A
LELSNKMIVIKVSDFEHLIGSKVFKNKPETCPHCYSKSMKDVELLGAYNGPLLWECDHCSIQLLRFSKETTNKHLGKLKDLHFDLEELDSICEGLPN